MKHSIQWFADRVGKQIKNLVTGEIITIADFQQAKDLHYTQVHNEMRFEDLKLPQ